ncbi:hypothetical protein ZWY2020_007636 [Hordeum vulgare]|nr:hypothetical protein ZWY2020_007636 [Hordeum vulgare]
MVGCAGSLYGSVERLDGTRPTRRPRMRCSPSRRASKSSSGLPPPSPQSEDVLRCRCSCGTHCPSCNNQMTTPFTIVTSAGSGGQAAAGESGKGFVQGIVTYTVMDDLTVTPMSSISSITLLNTLAVRDLAALQEKTVQLGYDKGLEILKASLQSKTVLTDVFLK